jgi:flagellar motor switch protein FliM
MQIEQIPFEIRVILGTTSLSLTTYQELQIGDILMLDQPVDQRLVVRVGQQERYQGTAGLLGIHKAVLLDERIYPQ